MRDDDGVIWGARIFFALVLLGFTVLVLSYVNAATGWFDWIDRSDGGHIPCNVVGCDPIRDDER